MTTPTAFDPLAHHILCLERKNRAIPLRDLLAYQKWVVEQDPRHLKVLEEIHRPVEPR
jgi:hypothetical protein